MEFLGYDLNNITTKKSTCGFENFIWFTLYKCQLCLVSLDIYHDVHHIYLNYNCKHHHPDGTIIHIDLNSNSKSIQ